MIRSHVSNSTGVLAAIGTFGIVGSAMGVTYPFTETFSGPAANWATSSAGPAASPLTYVASGGPDGSGFGRNSFSFVGSTAGAFPILFRAQDSFNSSGDAFVGDWVGAGVQTFSFDVRHNAPVSLQYFARFVAVGGFTGVIYQEPVLVPANTWTTVQFSVDPSTAFVFEPGTNFGVFSNLDRVQIGVTAPAELAGTTPAYTFDVDNVSLVPTPGASAVVMLGGVIAVRRRRASR